MLVVVFSCSCLVDFCLMSYDSLCFTHSIVTTVLRLPPTVVLEVSSNSGFILETAPLNWCSTIINLSFARCTGWNIFTVYLPVGKIQAAFFKKTEALKLSTLIFFFFHAKMFLGNDFFNMIEWVALVNKHSLLAALSGFEWEIILKWGTSFSEQLIPFQTETWDSHESGNQSQ